MGNFGAGNALSFQEYKFASDGEEADGDEGTGRERLLSCYSRSAELQDTRLSECHLLIPWPVCSEVGRHWTRCLLTEPFAVKRLALVE
jgi:hypothetical protein